MADVITLTGTRQGDVNLPGVFKTEYRPDLIKRAVEAQQSQIRQAQGVDPSAGLKTSADYFGSRRRSYRQTINRAMSRLPREKPGGGGLGKVRRVPQSVGGRLAHPPQTDRKHSQKINRKEYLKAVDSAIAATADKKLVIARNHKIGGKTSLPIIVEDKLEKIARTGELKETLAKIGLDEEIKTGKKYRLLIAVGEDAGIRKAAENIPGVHVAQVNELDLDLLAPGGKAGVLTVWTKNAIEKIGEKA